MLKLLKRQQGFTLVELLVVIAIIAILAVIGLTVFTGLQRGARDATRKSDVQSISKALEANYETSSALYLPLTKTMFAGGVFAQDPLNGQATSCAGAMCTYCVGNVSAGGIPPTGALATGSTCGSAASANSQLFQKSTADNTVPPVGTTGYIVCTNLEAAGTGSFYCQGNQR